MPVSTIERPVSALRQRMLEDMAMRGLRSHTQHDYIRFVRSFAGFLGRSPDTATAEDIRRFQVHQREIGVQPPTINGSVSALRFFFTVTLDRPDLSRRLVLARFPRKLPAVLSVEEVGRLLEAAPGPKYRAALGTAYGAGLRVSEVAALKIGDIDSTRMLIRVEQGKGRKDRNAMLSPQLLELLRLWWREGKRRGVMLPQGWLFPGRNSLEPISTRQINRAVHEAAEAAGIKKRVSPHTLRHSFATHLLEQDVDIRVIQVLLGHSKLDTTALYARVATKTIRSVTSPLEHLALLMEGQDPGS
jgi:integrase/recombinase XerD